MTKKFYIEDDPNGSCVKHSESAPLGFTEIVDQTEIKNQYVKIYNKRAKDGANLYNSIRADLAALFNSETITIEAAYGIEVALMSAKSFLLSGDWATAQYSLNQITINESYSQSIHDSIKLKVEYVELNY
jgi:hypothetical protein